MVRGYEIPCRPPLWARTGHLQTVFAHVLPTRAAALVAGVDGVSSHDVMLADGDRLRVLLREGSSDVLVHTFHGLSGDANVDYMRIAAAAARELGFGVLATNHRGCGDGRGLAAGIYHSGRDDDVAAVLAWGRRRFPAHQHLALGISLSGNALLLLAGRRQLPPPDAILAVNPPVDLGACSARIGRGFNRVYDRRFVRRCLEQLEQRRADGLLRDDVRIGPVAGLREFDDVFTARLAGFADAEDYYRRCSAKPWLHAIEVPTVILTTTDDPFVAVDDVLCAPRSARIHLHVERHGGHAGYLAAGRGALPERWLHGALRHYLAELAQRAAP